jgi:hypothetical protein
MTTLVASIAPQRSTQYGALADTLAPHELTLCPLHAPCTDIRPVELGGHPYLRCELAAPPDEHDLVELGMLATLDRFFVYHERVGEVDGPLLGPLATCFTPALPPDIVTTRRYKGKTNELFTHFLCNLARGSSVFADQSWGALRVFDPLAGGGTTVFTAMVLGAEAAGVERSASDIESTVAFVSQYLRDQGIRYTHREERLRKLGHRWSFGVGQPARRLILARGDTAMSGDLIPGWKPHFVVTDLPYGVQHQGEIEALLTTGLPAWTSMLLPGGTVVFSWDATRLERAEMVRLVESSSVLRVFDDPPYTSLAHRVDRAIKRRDVIVASVP